MSSRVLSVALVGNPNTGKTTLFNALTGLRHRVGNYPGVTVEMKKGRATHAGRTCDIIDLPGTYSFAARSPDEMVAVDLLLGQVAGEPTPDIVIAIVDASNLDRHLYLVTQLLELGRPIVIALNMLDVAAKQGVSVDAATLSERLAMPVVPIQANAGRGIDNLRAAIFSAIEAEPATAGPSFPEPFEREVASLRHALAGRGVDWAQFVVRRLLLDVGGLAETRAGPEILPRVLAARERLAAAGCSVPGVEVRTRYTWIRAITNGCIARPAQRPVTATDRLDRVLTHKLWGTLIFLGLMFLVFQS